MQVGDLVYHDMWGNGMIIKQQGVADRWHIRFINPLCSIGFSSNGNTRFCWGSELEVLSEGR